MTTPTAPTTTKQTNRQWYFNDLHATYFQLIDGVLWFAPTWTDDQILLEGAEEVDWQLAQGLDPHFGKFASLAEELRCTVVPELESKP